MVDYPKNEFTLWFNCMPDQKKDGHYWAAAEIPVDELEKLYNWALKQNPVQNQRGEPCVKLRANLMPVVLRSGIFKAVKFGIKAAGYHWVAVP